MNYNWDILNRKTYNNRTGHYKFWKEYEFITSNSKITYDKILDIAGGSGRFAIPLLDYSSNITVLDINATALQILRERNCNIKTICSDFIKAEIKETFSLIICIEALGNFHNLKDFFNKINKLLIDEGRVVFTYNNPSSWRFFLRKIKHWKKGAYPYKEINIGELKNVLKKCNFEIEKMEGMNWIPLPLSSNSRLVLLLNLLKNCLDFLVGIVKAHCS